MAAGLLLSGCSEVQSFPVQESEKPVKILQVPQNHNALSHRFSAQIEAGDRAQLAFRVPGQINAINVRMGEPVTQGAILATLDPTDYLIAVEARQAEYQLARVRLARTEQLFAQQLTSEDQRDRAQTELTVAQARLDQAKTDLAYTQLVAPFDGAVSLTHKRAHEVAGANEPVLNLQGDQALDIAFNLPGQYARLLSDAQPVQFSVRFAHHPGLQLPARYKESDAQPDRDTNSFRVILSVERPDNINLLPGMAAEVEASLPTDDRPLWFLPSEAIVARDGQRVTVWQVDEDDRLVPLDLILNSQGAVVSGADAGTRLVAAGAQELKAGQKVRHWVREGGL
ncbi:efflux RND transporter periplasmic adaptor subunit [Ferrimonas balearica]|uniref:efflux RND transporter periplasmic adaptor subunit n=1 Tax=Ferrimonas balearica TaxID=44012 RepID=UPI001C9A172D|nr:efflux RND transporter periplasmic adaptor subunit [Ferrimonas balearica]MBY5920135.1 efflux RND transporter periplasmic adaptor subunit [Ferrimonas balearica]MBY5997180.1 efflux RND transporter periplasmic adaptor subunit [Ferrimonas balearica]